jgi:ABC-type molybdate transport system substrate-binding protein
VQVPRKSVVAAAIILAGAAFWCLAGPAITAEVKVLSAVAVKSAPDELASAFEHKTGDKLTIAMLRLGRPSSASKAGKAPT